ncbi:CapA family protein [Paenibacillus qinlingensis]|uniref:Poly-gamma-glutamate synthesis protein (Capsule biosynthesis protein) n=1 Tax=Paenibacillus qinlingensis TaxID=1837343 RepID=A0ABU1NR59_9BACL|nr:CapA family protein [Paenibacillus qinlingensis]MDR6549938.1 poly-gamma-glutamate synthesis protein (capsule biosynthesis protein) [Paenibacillus qinlingensis]
MIKRMAAIVSTLILASGCVGSSLTPKDTGMEVKSSPLPARTETAPPPISQLHATAEQEPQPLQQQTQPQQQKQISKVTLGAIGDILIHDKVYLDAKQKDGTYNFKPIFEGVKALLQAPDILVANQETMIGGKEMRLSSYPTFNSPHEIGDALKYTGVDVVTIANNHALDRGEKVIQSALSYWDTLGIPYTGAFKSQNDRDNLRTLTKNGITFAFLSYTYGTNGISTPAGKPFLVNRIDDRQIRSDVEQAKPLADVIVVAMHWGNEYQRLPDKNQTALAHQLADMGVHILIGNHPHVLQPPAWVEGKNGHRTFVIYSLGNFLSAQINLYKQVGGMATVEVVKTTTSKTKQIEFSNPSFLPTYTYSQQGKQFQILSMDRLTNDQLPQASSNYQMIMKHMKTYIPELHMITSPKE